jgi:hypothetical protein
MRNGELWYTFITHAEQKGMSVLREGASDIEFRRAIDLRLKKNTQRFQGVVSFSCGDVRGLLAEANGDRRLVGDRLYYVLDTDADGRPNHADVFATIPRPSDDITLKAAFRRQRHRLMALLRDDLQSADAFRNGSLVDKRQ